MNQGILRWKNRDSFFFDYLAKTGMNSVKNQKKLFIF